MKKLLVVLMIVTFLTGASRCTSSTSRAQELIEAYILERYGEGFEITQIKKEKFNPYGAWIVPYRWIATVTNPKTGVTFSAQYSNEDGNVTDQYAQTLYEKELDKKLTEVLGGNDAFYAFDLCTSLKEVILPAGIETLEKNCFSDCTGLKTVQIPDSVKVIEEGCFYKCENLVNVNIPASVTALSYTTTPAGDVDGTFEGCYALERISLPAGLESIGEDCFSSCWKLKSIEIPANVTVLNDDVFSGCHGLERIVLHDNIVKIGRSAFSACNKLTTITLPASVKEIEDMAFGNCDILTHVVISEGTETIGDHCFSRCEALESVEIPASVTEIGTMIFKNCPDNVVIIGVAGSYAEQYAKENDISFQAK